MPKNYIPSPDYLTSMYIKPEFRGRWVVVEKVPISQIKIDKSQFSFQNEVSQTEVEWICKEFHVGAWFPIMVNSKYFLLDGQHRLAAAKKLKLKYVDVVVDIGDGEQEKVKSFKKAKLSAL